ncbi:hypothetical protein SMAC4_13312 [Sordaria macrospora]|uniref:uncharacterized protein n=1 Tax=Sordaria macrospora TaxID=5147 RepID=UPI002B285C86|nr:hypothetical protein SMAC4_13312 [Sordaria macrospora]
MDPAARVRPRAILGQQQTTQPCGPTMVQQPIPRTTTQIPSEVGRRTNGPLGLPLRDICFRMST